MTELALGSGIGHMFVEKVSVDSLTLDPENARKHGTRNIETIKESLRRFGQQKLVVVDEDGGVIAGNGTLIALRELGAPDVWVHRSTLQNHDLRAYALADNKTAELAEWDDEILGNSLRILSNLNIDMSSLGFDLGPQVAASEGKEFDEDAAKDVKMVTCPHCEESFPL